MKKFFKLFAALFVLCAVIFPTKSFAASDPNSEEFLAFREALTKDSDSLERIFRQDIFFASPFVQGELDILGMIDGNAFKCSGDVSLWIYNDDGTVKERVIPFYVEQNQKEMNIYFKPEKQWQKFTAPSLSAAVTDFVATPTESEIEQIIRETKDVTIMQDNEYRRILLVRPDGNAIADSFKKLSDENPADNGTAEEAALQETIVGYFENAFRNGDMWYMWTIDKRDWHTVTMQFSFTGIIQELARAALNDPNQNWPDEVSMLFETIGYYSEIRAYTTYPADPAAKKQIEVPKDVMKKAKLVQDLVSSEVK